MCSHTKGIQLIQRLIQHFIYIEKLLFASVDEDQTAQRIQSDPDLHFLLTVIYTW